MITIKSGPGLSVSVESADYPTVGDIAQDANLQAVLRFGDNSEFVVNGVIADENASVVDGSTVVIQPKAAKKAASLR